MNLEAKDLSEENDFLSYDFIDPRKVFFEELKLLRPDLLYLNLLNKYYNYKLINFLEACELISYDNLLLDFICIDLRNFEVLYLKVDLVEEGLEEFKREKFIPSHILFDKFRVLTGVFFTGEGFHIILVGSLFFFI
jgi:hypothetical protein